MKLHAGADDHSGLMRRLASTAATMHELTSSDQLLHGEEARVWADAGDYVRQSQLKTPIQSFGFGQSQMSLVS